MKRFPLRLQLLIGFALLLAITLFFLTAILINQTTEATHHNYELRFDTVAHELTRTLEEKIGVQLATEGEINNADLDQWMAQLTREKQLGLMLLNPDGERLIAYSPEDAAWFYEEYAGNFATNYEVRAVIQAGDAVGESYDDLYATAVPVMVDDEMIALFHLTEMRPQLYDQITAQSRRMSVGGVVVGVASMAVLLFWLTRTLTKPLGALKHSAEQMAAGDLSKRADTRAPGEISQLATSFNQMAAAVEGMVLEQRAFASNAAHELRTPLTTIRLRTEAIIEDDLSAEKRDQYIQEIDDEARRLTQLVDDLRLLSQVDAAQISVGSEQVDVARLAQAIERSLQPALTAKQLSLNLLVVGDVRPMQANMSHLRVVFRNIVENAIKYTEQGQIDWRFEAVDDQLEMVVRDTGVGISADDLPHVLNRFYRADKARNRQIAGTGLGLSLVQSIIDLYGGTITVQSDGISMGTSVRVVLPLQQIDEELSAEKYMPAA